MPSTLEPPEESSKPPSETVPKDLIEQAVAAAQEHYQIIEDGPSNPVIERVGEDVFYRATELIRSGVRIEDAIKDLREKDKVHLSIGEFRLLLASRVKPRGS